MTCFLTEKSQAPTAGIYKAARVSRGLWRGHDIREENSLRGSGFLQVWGSQHPQAPQKCLLPHSLHLAPSHRLRVSGARTPFGCRNHGGSSCTPAEVHVLTVRLGRQRGEIRSVALPELRLKDGFPGTSKPEGPREAGAWGAGGALRWAQGPSVPSRPQGGAAGPAGGATWLGMALFLFSCVLLCWALKPKHREGSCGETPGGTRSKRPSRPRWGFCPSGARVTSYGQRWREAACTHRPAPGKQLRLMEQAEVSSQTEASRP